MANETTILFWNVNREPLVDEITRLAIESDADIIALAECVHDDRDLLHALNTSEAVYHRSALIIDTRIRLYVRYLPTAVAVIHDDDYVSVREIRPPLGPTFLIAAAHLPSRLHLDRADQNALAHRLARRVIEAEEKCGHTRSIVVGDLNMNPFDEGIVSSEGLHAVMDRRVATKLARTVLGERRHYFYNPMWRFLRESESGASGTYYYANNAPICYFWNTFDQILVRPSLLSYMGPDAAHVVSSIGGQPLVTPEGRCGPSDHLPVRLTLSTEVLHE